MRITSRRGDVVLTSAEDYASWQETICLLRFPANARRLMGAIARDKESSPAI
ncbi:MAG: type II toxin-antitoxin system Phd/YefM family antitoxin [Streptosporangiaceae bacterium]